jgi:hypothetical protein
MILRVVFLVLGVSLLIGCGRRDHPTVRRIVPDAAATGSAGVAAEVASEDDTSHPESTGRRLTRPKRELRRPQKPVEPPPSASDSTPPDEPAEAKPAEARPAPEAPRSDKDTTANAPREEVKTPIPAKVSESPRAQPSVPRVASAASREIRIGDKRLAAPATWKRERTQGKFMLAEFTLPRSAGDDEDAQVTVTAPVQNNAKALARLREEIKEQEASSDTVEHLTIGDVEVVFVDSLSDNEDASDPSSGKVQGGRSRSLNAMFFMGNTVYYINLTGPEKTVGARAAEFHAFLRTMR